MLSILITVLLVSVSTYLALLLDRKLLACATYVSAAGGCWPVAAAMAAGLTGGGNRPIPAPF